MQILSDSSQLSQPASEPVDVELIDGVSRKPGEPTSKPSLKAKAIALLRLGEITLDDAIQPRAELDQVAIEEYADDMRDGDEFPPLVVYHDGKVHWLSEGFHRWHAARKADLLQVACEIRKGTRDDALLNAVGSNASHGVRRTNADKRRAVTLLLSCKTWSERSARWIADKCGVHHELVSSLRSQLADSASPRIGKDGKARPAKRNSRKAETNGSTLPDEQHAFDGPAGDDHEPDDCGTLKIASTTDDPVNAEMDRLTDIDCICDGIGYDERRLNKMLHQLAKDAKSFGLASEAKDVRSKLCAMHAAFGNFLHLMRDAQKAGRSAADAILSHLGNAPVEPPIASTT